MKTEELQTLIDEFKVLPPEKASEPTLLDIARFPHWETVFSNILAFFLNSTGPHGFSTLMLEALMSLRSTRNVQLQNSLVEQTVYVDTEVQTETGKFIDIEIITNGHVIGIENKIYSGLHNDLADYRSKLISDAKSHDIPEEHVIGFVLAPSRLTDWKIRENDFTSITYKELMGAVDNLLGKYLTTSNTRYQYLLLDFIEHCKRFDRRENMTDEQREFLDFWKNNTQKIDNMQNQMQALKDVLSAPAITRSQKEKLEAEFGFDLVKVSVYGKETLVVDFADALNLKPRVFLDVSTSPVGMSIFIGNREKDFRAANMAEIFGSCAGSTGTDFEGEELLIGNKTRYVLTNKEIDTFSPDYMEKSIELIRPYVKSMVEWAKMKA